MKGANGRITVKLPGKISINAVSIDHIPKNEALDIQSAPRMFRVYGHTDEDTSNEKAFLGQGAYSLDDGALYSQTFPFSTKSMPVRFVTFEFLNNHGHRDYTCVYRVRVHGDSEAEVAAMQAV
jgi:SUN domain-containing protein 1/2